MPKRVIVVGGGLAGLAATIRAAEKGISVDLFSVVPVKRSHSVCAQGGINSAKNMKGEGDDPSIHVTDTLFGGEYLADQPLVKGMCYAGPSIIDLLDRMGVPFNRTPEGHLDFRRFGGTLHHRTAFAGATTGQQLLYALDEQVRRFEVQGLVEKYEHWEFLSLVLDGKGEARGITAMNLWQREVRVFKANAVILCTGGPGLVFGRSTNSIINTGAAAARAYQQGVWYGNGEFIQVHPTAIPGADKLRLISESVRGEGGRVWVPKDPADRRAPTSIPEAERDYFLERKYPKYGNLVPRDVATREIFHVCTVEKRGVDGGNSVYLDITPPQSKKSPEVLEEKLGGVLEIYRKFVGDDPVKTPMKIFPGMHYSMGGLWVGYRDEGSMVAQMTNLPGVFAAGEAEFQYHGGNRLGANSLLSCIYGGMEAGIRAADWVKSHSDEAPESVYTDEKKRQDEINDSVMKMGGKENPYALHRELGDWMTARCTVVRDNAGLDELLNKLNELEERWNNIDVNDRSVSANQSFGFTRALRDMIILAKAMAKGARMRDESRGAHYKPAFDLAKPDGGKIGNAHDHDGYRAYAAEIAAKWNTTFKLPEKSTTPITPEFSAYMDRWIEIQKQWNRTTIAKFIPGQQQPEISYRDVALTVEPPKPRIYK
ncbi:MAG TPA: succinate dehydrogenase flavoprotein subunit [Candidatus Sumerlaeota bacterium]|nr:succinate dehydrogenase flavoprotein subunit [Candidatus Sumerlaeota bacterium]